MKKILILVLSLVLCLVAVSVFAENDEVQVVDWETDILPQLGDNVNMGDFYIYENFGMKVWIPNNMKQVDVTAEEAASGYADRFITEDEKYVISVFSNDIGKDFDTYFNDLQTESDIESVKRGKINGLNAIFYHRISSDQEVFSFTGGDNWVVELYFSPATDADFATFIQIIAASVQALSE
ncbi:MAG: hypothetical protein IJ088_07345 [Clostridia bacterium]|nr:hypothetical protein [Clostridia bacterium]